jgi:hypothetical protein
MVFNIGNRSYTTSELNKELKSSEPTFKNWSGARKISLGSEEFKFNEILDAVGTTIKNQKESGQVFSNNDDVHSIFKRLVELKDQGHEKTGFLYSLFRRFFPNTNRDLKIKGLESTIESAFPSAENIKIYILKNRREFTKETEAEIVNRADKDLSIYNAAQLIDYYLSYNLTDKLNQLLPRLSSDLIQNVYKNFTQNLVLTKILAEKDNADAQVNLGFMYNNGQGGLEKSEGKAVEWYAKAAEQGHAVAQVNLGIMYFHGQGGLEKSERKAVEYFAKAAVQGFAAAQRNLGIMYQTGQGGLEKSNEKAAEWYAKAAKQGDAIAQKNLDNLNSWRNQRSLF